ncbi:MAG: patatin-like phospholipase family protein [Pseudoxanthomonas sp.]
MPNVERALVLGGGGSTGNAWLIGIIAGLFEAGLNVTEADLIIGTSAGSTAAAQMSSGIPPTDLLADILTAQPQSLSVPAKFEREPVASRPATNHMEKTRAIINAAEDAGDMRRRMGAAAIELDGASDSIAQTQWRATVAARLPSHRWPQQPLLITAVDACTGEPVVFDRHSGIHLVDAVAASCAGNFAYTIGKNRYIDGGYRADVNADLAAEYGRVLVIPPLGGKTRKPLHWGLHLAAQVDDLRVRGRRVETVFPDSESESALGVGMSLMDLSTRRIAAQAGYNQGKGLAEQLSNFWC